MRWSDIPWNPSARTLRQFALLFLVCFAGLAAWNGGFAGRAALGWICGLLAVTIGMTGLIRPVALRPVFVGWLVLAFPAGWLVSHAVLAAAYYGLFTPLGLIFRCSGRDSLCLRPPSPGTTTYWKQRPTAATLESYFRPF